MDAENKILLTEHLEELRQRLMNCLVAVAFGFIGCYCFKEYLFEILKQPLAGTEFIVTAIHEGFFTYMKVALIFGLLVAAPVILYQFWVFVAPGLYKNEKKLFFPILFLSSFFFIGGALFGYFIVFPIGFKFLLTVTPSDIIPRLSMREYLSFSSKLLVAFGLVFELPLILTLMAKLGIVTADFLKKNRKYALLLFFIGSAILTPPDVITQVMMAFPMMLLYEISILGAVVFGRKHSEDETQ